MEVDRVPQDGAGAAPDTAAGPVDAAVSAVPAVSTAATGAPVPRDARVYLPATASADPEQGPQPAIILLLLCVRASTTDGAMLVSVMCQRHFRTASTRSTSRLRGS